MADVVGDPDNQEGIMCQQLIAEQQHKMKQIAMFTSKLSESEEKLELQKKQSSESERSSPDVPDKNVKKVSVKRILEDPVPHRAIMEMKMKPLQPERGGWSSSMYYVEQKGRIDRSRESKWFQDRFDHRSQDHREPHERYRDLLAERGQPDSWPPERPHWGRRLQDKNLSGRPHRDRKFNKQDGDRQGRQRVDGPKGVKSATCRVVCFSSPEKMDELQNRVAQELKDLCKDLDTLLDKQIVKVEQNIKAVEQHIKDLCTIFDKDASDLKATEKMLKLQNELARLEQDKTYWKNRLEKLEHEQKDRREKLELEQKDRMEKCELEHNIKELAILEQDKTYGKDCMEKLAHEQTDRRAKCELQQKVRMEKLEHEHEKLELEQKDRMEKLELEQKDRMEKLELEHNIKELAILQQDKTYWKDSLEKLAHEQQDRRAKCELRQKDCREKLEHKHEKRELEQKDRMEKLELEQKDRMEKLELEHNMKELAILEQDKTCWLECMEKLAHEQKDRRAKLELQQKDRREELEHEHEKCELEQKDCMEKLEHEQKDRMEKLELEHNMKELAILEQDKTSWKECMEKLAHEQKDRRTKLDLQQKDRREKLEHEHEKLKLEQKDRMEKLELEHDMKELAILEQDKTYWKDCMEKLAHEQKDRWARLKLEHKDRMEKLELEHNIKELAILRQDKIYWKDRMEKLELEQMDRREKLELEQKDRREKLELKHNINKPVIFKQDKTWRDCIGKLELEQKGRWKKVEHEQKDRRKTLKHEQKDRREKLEHEEEKLEHNVLQQIRDVEQRIKDLDSMFDKEDKGELKASEKVNKVNISPKLTTLNKELSILTNVRLIVLETVYCKNLIKTPCRKNVKCREVDGINLDTFYLSRTALINKVMGKLAEKQFILLSSLAASGKTSLLTIMEHCLGYKCIYISCLSSLFSSSDVLSGKGNDDYNDPYILTEIDGACIVMLGYNKDTTNTCIELS